MVLLKGVTLSPQTCLTCNFNCCKGSVPRNNFNGNTGICTLLHCCRYIVPYRICNCHKTCIIEFVSVYKICNLFVCIKKRNINFCKGKRPHSFLLVFPYFCKFLLHIKVAAFAEYDLRCTLYEQCNFVGTIKICNGGHILPLCAEGEPFYHFIFQSEFLV